MKWQWINELSTMRKTRLHQRSLHPIGQRLRRMLNALITKRPDTRNGVFLVNIKGNQFKRVVMRDSYMSSQIASNLAAFRSSSIFPELVLAYENEIWLDYLEGKLVGVLDQDVIEKVAFFYSVLYNQEPVKVATEKYGFNQSTQFNLRFLNKVGVIENSLLHELSTITDAVTPQDVWVGYDYTDPFPYNFIITPDEQLRAVDVESVRANCLIGCGVAKALAIWKEPSGDQLLVEMKKLPIPDFVSYLPFVELYYWSEWMKRSFLLGRTAFVKPSLFDKVRHIK
jgi:hypothetical protein